LRKSMMAEASFSRASITRREAEATARTCGKACRTRRTGMSNGDHAPEMLLVGSKTKAALKAHDVNVAGDALDALNLLMYWYIEQAAKRAKANGRKTVRGHDFMAR